MIKLIVKVQVSPGKNPPSWAAIQPLQVRVVELALPDVIRIVYPDFLRGKLFVPVIAYGLAL